MRRGGYLLAIASRIKDLRRAHGAVFCRCIDKRGLFSLRLASLHLLFDV